MCTRSTMYLSPPLVPDVSPSIVLLFELSVSSSSSSVGASHVPRIAVRRLRTTGENTYIFTYMGKCLYHFYNTEMHRSEGEKKDDDAIAISTHASDTGTADNIKSHQFPKAASAEWVELLSTLTSHSSVHCRLRFCTARNRQRSERCRLKIKLIICGDICATTSPSFRCRPLQ